MSEYPYLAALLPTLDFGAERFPTPGTFLGEAEKWLSEKEFAILSSVGFDDWRSVEHPVELVADYCRFERAVRKDVAAFVDSRRQGHEHKTRAFPTSILKDATPLEAERRLLRLRWDFVNQRLETHFWDLHALIVYFLKLQILQRLSAFDESAGAERFAALTDGERLLAEEGGES